MDKKALAKNAGSMLASQLITWSFAFLLTVFLPRYMGAEAVGQYSIALALWIIVGVLLNFGMDTYITKSVARQPERAGEDVVTSLVARTLLFAVGCVLVAAYLYVMKYSIEIVYLSIIVGLYTWITLLAGALNAALIGLERVSYVSISNVADKVSMTLLSLLLLFLGFNIYWIVAMNIVGSAIKFGILGYYLRQISPLRPRFSAKEIYTMLVLSSPYMIGGMTLMVYQQLDKLFISAMGSIEAVGWYGTAMNLFGTLMFLPAALSTVIFPMMTRSYAAGEAPMAAVARRSFDLMFMLSIPIGMGVIIVADPLVLLLYGPAFAPAGRILAMLGLVLIFTYLNTIIGPLLIATERTKQWNIVMIAATIATIPLDLFLVPWAHATYANGALGGAIAFTITETGMLCAAVLLLPKGTLQLSNLRTVILSSLAGLAMVATSWWWRDSYLILSVIIGAVTYPSLVLLLRIVPRQDLMLLKEGLSKILGRFRRSKPAPASLSVD